MTANVPGRALSRGPSALPVGNEAGWLAAVCEGAAIDTEARRWLEERLSQLPDNAGACHCDAAQACDGAGQCRNLAVPWAKIDGEQQAIEAPLPGGSSPGPGRPSANGVRARDTPAARKG